MAGFMILEIDRVEIIWAGQYYGAGCTNNQAESFTVQDTL